MAYTQKDLERDLAGGGLQEPPTEYTSEMLEADLQQTTENLNNSATTYDEQLTTAELLEQRKKAHILGDNQSVQAITMAIESKQNKAIQEEANDLPSLDNLPEDIPVNDKWYGTDKEGLVGKLDGDASLRTLKKDTIDLIDHITESVLVEHNGQKGYIYEGEFYTQNYLQQKMKTSAQLINSQEKEIQDAMPEDMKKALQEGDSFFGAFASTISPDSALWMFDQLDAVDAGGLAIDAVGTGLAAATAWTGIGAPTAIAATSVISGAYTGYHEYDNHQIQLMNELGLDLTDPKTMVMLKNDPELREHISNEAMKRAAADGSIQAIATGASGVTTRAVSAPLAKVGLNKTAMTARPLEYLGTQMAIESAATAGAYELSDQDYTASSLGIDAGSNFLLTTPEMALAGLRNYKNFPELLTQDPAMTNWTNKYDKLNKGQQDNIAKAVDVLVQKKRDGNVVNASVIRAEGMRNGVSEENISMLNSGFDVLFHKGSSVASQAGMAGNFINKSKAERDAEIIKHSYKEFMRTQIREGGDHYSFTKNLNEADKVSFNEANKTFKEEMKKLQKDPKHDISDLMDSIDEMSRFNEKGAKEMLKNGMGQDEQIATEDFLDKEFGDAQDYKEIIKSWSDVMKSSGVGSEPAAAQLFKMFKKHGLKGGAGLTFLGIIDPTVWAAAISAGSLAELGGLAGRASYRLSKRVDSERINFLEEAVKKSKKEEGSPKTFASTSGAKETDQAVKGMGDITDGANIDEKAFKKTVEGYIEAKKEESKEATNNGENFVKKDDYIVDTDAGKVVGKFPKNLPGYKLDKDFDVDAEWNKFKEENKEALKNYTPEEIEFMEKRFKEKPTTGVQTAQKEGEKFINTDNSDIKKADSVQDVTPDSERYQAYEEEMGKTGPVGERKATRGKGKKNIPDEFVRSGDFVAETDTGQAYSEEGGTSSDKGQSDSEEGVTSSDTDQAYLEEGVTSSDKGQDYSEKGGTNSDTPLFDVFYSYIPPQYLNGVKQPAEAVGDFLQIEVPPTQEAEKVPEAELFEGAINKWLLDTDERWSLGLDEEWSLGSDDWSISLDEKWLLGSDKGWLNKFIDKHINGKGSVKTPEEKAEAIIAEYEAEESNGITEDTTPLVAPSMEPEIAPINDQEVTAYNEATTIRNNRVEREEIETVRVISESMESIEGKDGISSEGNIIKIDKVGRPGRSGYIPERSVDIEEFSLNKERPVGDIHTVALSTVIPDSERPAWDKLGGQGDSAGRKNKQSITFKSKAKGLGVPKEGGGADSIMLSDDVMSRMTDFQNNPTYGFLSLLEEIKSAEEYIKDSADNWKTQEVGKADLATKLLNAANGITAEKNTWVDVFGKEFTLERTNQWEGFGDPEIKEGAGSKGHAKQVVGYGLLDNLHELEKRRVELGGEPFYEMKDLAKDPTSPYYSADANAKNSRIVFSITEAGNKFLQESKPLLNETKMFQEDDIQPTIWVPSENAYIGGYKDKLRNNNSSSIKQGFFEMPVKQDHQAMVPLRDKALNIVGDTPLISDTKMATDTIEGAQYLGVYTKSMLTPNDAASILNKERESISQDPLEYVEKGSREDLSEEHLKFVEDADKLSEDFINREINKLKSRQGELVHNRERTDGTGRKHPYATQGQSEEGSGFHKTETRFADKKPLGDAGLIEIQQKVIEAFGSTFEVITPDAMRSSFESIWSDVKHLTDGDSSMNWLMALKNGDEIKNPLYDSSKDSEGNTINGVEQKPMMKIPKDESFISAILELRRAEDGGGADFESNYMVGKDQRQSANQIGAVITRNRRMSQLTALIDPSTDSGILPDIYMEVVGELRNAVLQTDEYPDLKAELLELSADNKINLDEFFARELGKAPTMTRSYNATKVAFSEQGNSVFDKVTDYDVKLNNVFELGRALEDVVKKINGTLELRRGLIGGATQAYNSMFTNVNNGQWRADVPPLSIRAGTGQNISLTHTVDAKGSGDDKFSYADYVDQLQDAADAQGVPLGEELSDLATSYEKELRDVWSGFYDKAIPEVKAKMDNAKATELPKIVNDRYKANVIEFGKDHPGIIKQKEELNKAYDDKALVVDKHSAKLSEYFDDQNGTKNEIEGSSKAGEVGKVTFVHTTNMTDIYGSSRSSGPFMTFPLDTTINMGNAITMNENNKWKGTDTHDDFRTHPADAAFMIEESLPEAIISAGIAGRLSEQELVIKSLLALMGEVPPSDLSSSENRGKAIAAISKNIVGDGIAAKAPHKRTLAKQMALAYDKSLGGKNNEDKLFSKMDEYEIMIGKILSNAQDTTIYPEDGGSPITDDEIRKGFAFGRTMSPKTNEE